MRKYVIYCLVAVLLIGLVPIITSIEFPANERQFKQFLEQIIEINDTYRGRKEENAEREKAG